MMFRRLRFVAAATLALWSFVGISVGAVSAHAQYANSTPPANSTVSAAPRAVQITYTEELSNIRISVTGPDGQEVTTGPATFDLENRHNASVPVSDHGPGLYTVLWHNVSGDDGDPNDGQFVFTIAGSAPAPPTPAAQAPGAPTTTTSAPTAAVAAPACTDNGVRTPGISDSRIDTYCKRQAIRDKYAGQIDVLSFNFAVADGEGLESALADAMADFQMEQSKKH